MANSFNILKQPNLDTTKYDSVVGMSVFRNDRLDWLQQSIESVLTQSYQGYIFIIVIDGEVSPNMKGFLHKTAENNNNILLVQTDINVGLSACMNFVIDYTLANLPSAKFFFRMDADDISLETRFSKQVEFLEKHQEIHMLGTSLVEVNEKGKQVGKRLLPQTHSEIISMLPKRCAINHPTVCIRMSAFENGFRYREELRNTQDYFLWIDFCEGGLQLANLPETLLKFRRVNDFYKRRGFSKSLNEYKARFYAMKHLNAYSVGNLIYANGVIVLRLMPAKLIKLAYKLDRYLLNK